MELSVASLPKIAPACPLDRLEIGRCLEILAAGTFESPRDRAAFYSRDAQRVGSSWGEGDFSFNQALLERFVEREAERLGWKKTLASPEVPHAEIFYVTMHQLIEGIALARLTQDSRDKPALVHFLGEEHRNDSGAATAALIDRVAGTFSLRARGLVTVAVDDSEPDTFFRRIEHQNLMLNPEVSEVRALSAGVDRRLFERAERSELRDIVLVERVFRKEEWNQWQREQWLDASIGRLLRTAGSGSNGAGAAQARFFGEIFLICNEIDRLRRSEDRGAAERLIEPELRRLGRCAGVIGDPPSLLTIPADPSFTESFGSLVSKYSTPSAGGLMRFARDEARKLLDRMEGTLSEGTRQVSERGS